GAAVGQRANDEAATQYLHQLVQQSQPISAATCYAYWAVSTWAGEDKLLLGGQGATTAIGTGSSAVGGPFGVGTILSALAEVGQSNTGPYWQLVSLEAANNHGDWDDDVRNARLQGGGTCGDYEQYYRK